MGPTAATTIAFAASVLAAFAAGMCLSPFYRRYLQWLDKKAMFGGKASGIDKERVHSTYRVTNGAEFTETLREAVQKRAENRDPQPVIPRRRGIAELRKLAEAESMLPVTKQAEITANNVRALENQK
jgi:hypothetical protein